MLCTVKHKWQTVLVNIWSVNFNFTLAKILSQVKLCSLFNNKHWQLIFHVLFNVFMCVSFFSSKTFFVSTRLYWKIEYWTGCVLLQRSYRTHVPLLFHYSTVQITHTPTYTTYIVIYFMVPCLYNWHVSNLAVYA